MSDATVGVVTIGFVLVVAVGAILYSTLLLARWMVRQATRRAAWRRLMSSTEDNEAME